MNNISRIELIPEMDRKDICIVNIETVRVFYEDDEYEDDRDASFEFSYNEEDDDSYNEMLKEVHKKYRIPVENISVNHDVF